MRSNLTLNYGLRYDFMEPWYDKYNQIQTFIPGRQSVVYPTGPAGLRLSRATTGFPGTLSPARNKFSPRVGIAYVPSFSDGLLKTLFGGRRAEQHPLELRDFLHGDSRTVGRHHVQHSAVRRELPEPGAAAVRDAVHHRRRRHEQRSAVPAHARAARRLAEQARHVRRLVAAPADQRRPVLLPRQRRAVHAELHVLDRPAAGRRPRDDAELRRQPGPQHPRRPADQPRRSGALPEREPGESGGAGQRDVRTVLGKRRLHQGRRHGHQRHAAVRAELRQHHRAAHHRAVAVQRLRGGSALHRAARRIPVRLHARQVDGHVVVHRRADQSVRSRCHLGAVGVRRASQFHRQLQLRPAVRAPVPRRRMAGRRGGRFRGLRGSAAASR